MSALLSHPAAIISIQRMVCTGCGAEANASCNCGVSYVPKAVRAAEAIKANPERSDRAIAAEIGVAKNTVRDARRELVSTDQLEDGPRTGIDGKTRRVPQRRSAWEKSEDEIAEAGARMTAREAKRALKEQEERDRQECITLYQKVTDVEGEMAAAVDKIRQEAIAKYLGDGDIVERALTLIAKMDDGERQRFDAAYTLRFCDPVLN